MKHRQLEAFRAVMNVGSITGAADMLSVSQPAVSRLISALEHSLRFELFERRGNRIVPTDEAQRFFVEVDRAFLRLDFLEQAAQSIRDATQGSLRVAVAPIIAHRFMPATLTSFFAKFPDAYVELAHGSRQRVINSVASQVYDIAIEIPPVNEPAVRETHLLTQQVGCIVPRDHPLATRKRVEIEQLRAFPLILPEAGSVLRRRIEDAFARHKVGPRPRLESTTQRSICELVAAGHGVGIVGIDNVAADLRTRLVTITLHPSIEVKYSLFTPTTRPVSQLASEFIRLLMEQVGP